MTIETFAQLKEYFPKVFELESTLSTVDELKLALLQLQPQAASVLNRCRFAINNQFVDHQYQIQPHDTICVIPPSSGG